MELLSTDDFISEIDKILVLNYPKTSRFSTPWLTDRTIYNGPTFSINDYSSSSSVINLGVSALDVNGDVSISGNIHSPTIEDLESRINFLEKNLKKQNKKEKKSIFIFLKNLLKRF
jgi:hypothetical protein